jgi:prevent-host-death family protein
MAKGIRMLTVNVHGAKTHFFELVEQAHDGMEIILVKTGIPYARLMPLVAPSGKRQPGRLVCRVDAAFFEPLPDIDLAAWEGK